MRIFTRNTNNPKYKFLSTLEKLEMLKDDMQKLRKKHIKNNDLVETIDNIERIVNVDIHVLEVGVEKEVENEIKDFIKKTRNSFAKFELSLVLQPNDFSN